MKQLLTLAAISCTTIVLTACGDDVTNVTENNVGVQSFESLKKFPDCTKDNQGEMAMSQKDGKLYYCVDSSWVQMVAESSVGANGENGSDGKDGSDGANGKDGENGKDGTSCTAIETKKGIEVSCGDKVIGTLTNGKDGKPGNDGENGVDGKNCEITDKGDGVLEIKCGDKTEKIYKAMCGLNSYDPEISFCFKNKLYSCDNKPYNPYEEFCDERNFKIYKYVTIGTQTWMAENLNYDTLSNYCYDNNPDNCKIYGRLYTWASAMGKSEDDCGEGHECGVTEFPHQGVCPEGWHLPIEEEWLSLKAYIDTDVGKKLKSEEGWSDKGKGLDTYGFSALPAGGYYGSGDFFDVGEQAFFWSATESENDNIYAYNVYIINLSDLLLNAYDHKDGTYSVRCLKD